MQSYLDLAIDRAARVSPAVAASGRPGPGFLHQPTVIAGLDNAPRGWRRRGIFGPVLTIIAHDGDDDAIRIANDSYYGLPALIRLAPIRTAHRPPPPGCRVGWSTSTAGCGTPADAIRQVQSQSVSAGRWD